MDCRERREHGEDCGLQEVPVGQAEQARLRALSSALRGCATREAWSEMIAWAAMSALSAPHAFVAFESPDAARPCTSITTEALGGELHAAIHSRGRLIAVLVVSERTRDGGFTPADVSLLAALAEAAGRACPWSR